jgi:shikimate dehydrogenase
VTTNHAPRSFVLGLIGQGVGPSLTPELHEREALRQGLRYAYKTVDLSDDRVDPAHLRRLLDFAVELGFDGLNVTHPVKQMMVPLVDRTSRRVAAIRALNTVLIRDGVTHGHNTDVTGFAASLRTGLPNASLDRVLLLGAGGAGTAVAHALIELGAGGVLVADQDLQRARRLVATLGADLGSADVEAVPLSAVAGHAERATGLVNATPVGMAAHPGTPLDPALLREDLWVADIVYRPLLTELIRAARTRGCRTLSGAGMAVHQAADAFELVTGRTADRSAMFADFDDLVAHEVSTSVLATGDTTEPDPARDQRRPK